MGTRVRRKLSGFGDYEDRWCHITEVVAGVGV